MDLGDSRREHLTVAAVTCTLSAESTGVEGRSTSISPAASSRHRTEVMNTPKTLKNINPEALISKLRVDKSVLKGQHSLG